MEPSNNDHILQLVKKLYGLNPSFCISYLQQFTVEGLEGCS
jgi:hypothetical protein